MNKYNKIKTTGFNIGIFRNEFAIPLYLSWNCDIIEIQILCFYLFVYLPNTLRKGKDWITLRK
jgi:hypothetical protein